MPPPIVVKIGGEVVLSGEIDVLAPEVAALGRAGQPVVIVHGGGPQVSDLQKRLGQTPHVVAGRRVTDLAALEAVKMAVAGKVNVEVCAALVRAGARPVGLHGPSSLVLRARKRPPRVVTGAGPDPIDFGHVGDIVGVNDDLVRLLLSAGHVPVLACLGADEDGAVYNINADVVASRVALLLGAGALVAVSDVPGVLRDVADPASRIPRLSVAEARRAIAEGVVTKGMIPKLEESFAALEAGVPAVHVLGRLAPGDLVRAVADPGSVGTVIYLSGGGS